MQLVFFDTEYTAWHGSQARGWAGAGEHREIIQIGAIKLNKKLRISAKFNVLVQPYFNPKLSEYIIHLTGITQDKIDTHGMGLDLAVEKLRDFCGNHVKTILISNGGDDLIIKENLELLGKKFHTQNMIFYNIQPLIKKIYKSDQHVSIEQVAKKMGISGRFHSAISDCIFLYMIAKKLDLLELIINQNIKDIILPNE